MDIPKHVTVNKAKNDIHKTRFYACSAKSNQYDGITSKIVRKAYFVQNCSVCFY